MRRVQKTGSKVEFVVPSMLPDDRVASAGEIQRHARLYFKTVNGESVYPPGVFHRMVCKCIRWSQLTCHFPHKCFLKEARFAACLFRLLQSESNNVLFFSSIFEIDIE